MEKLKQRTVAIAENGRMNLPSDMRRALGLSGPGRVILTQDDTGIHISTVDHSLKRIRELMAPFRQEGRSMVDELIKERRAEATHEAGSMTDE